jgi:hypothetical protein
MGRTNTSNIVGGGKEIRFMRLGNITQPLAVITAAFALLSANAHAADFDGTYTGIQTVTGRTGDSSWLHVCGDSRTVTVTVKDSTMVSRSGWTSKVGADGTFQLSGRINSDNDVMTVTGVISGKTLKATWRTPGRRVTCSGEYSAERQ